METRKIDFAADDLDLDAAVLRQAPFGDIQLGHELEAADDGGLELARRRFLIEEHAVHAEAHAEFLLERLDVNIAGALLDGLGDHGVDQADDGRLARHIAQVFEIGAGLLVVALGVGALFGFAVIAVDGVEDFLLGGERGAHLQAAEGAHGGDGLVTPTYVFATPVLGGQAAVGMTTLYGRNTTSVSGTLTGRGSFVIWKQFRLCHRIWRLISGRFLKMESGRPQLHGLRDHRHSRRRL